ncbi:MAG: hypothetical protein Q4F60_03575 [Candidatus Saccharibacteria bacterium]|nr:hypothetical protein [Candidatus Saccharibacteria bacterium]
MSEDKQKEQDIINNSPLVLILKAKDEATAKRKLQAISVSKAADYKYLKITNGIFWAYLPGENNETSEDLAEEKLSALTSRQIAKFERNGIFIVASRYSREKSVEIYRRYTELEINTRALLMIALSLMNQKQYVAFFETVIRDLKYKNKRDPSARKHSISATINKLTLGEVIIMLGLNYGAVLKRERLSEIIDESLREAGCFEDFRRKYKSGMEARYMWDEIGMLLKEKISTRKMEKCFEEILEVRNKVAHSKIIGTDDYEIFMKNYNIVSPIVKPENYHELDGQERRKFTRSFTEACRALSCVTVVFSGEAAKRLGVKSKELGAELTAALGKVMERVE